MYYVGNALCHLVLYLRYSDSVNQHFMMIKLLDEIKKNISNYYYLI